MTHEIIAGCCSSLDVAQLQLAGGGNFDQSPQQQMAQPEIRVEVVAPPQDNTLLITTGIVVPVVLAILGWWLTHRLLALRPRWKAYSKKK
jgi:hypothetical protein